MFEALRGSSPCTPAGPALGVNQRHGCHWQSQLFPLNTNTSIIPEQLHLPSIPLSLNFHSSPSYTLIVCYGHNLRPSVYGGSDNFRRPPDNNNNDEKGNEEH
jgi:hypothetical protein